jgi:hypothetical protein
VRVRVVEVGHYGRAHAVRTGQRVNLPPGMSQLPSWLKWPNVPGLPEESCNASKPEETVNIDEERSRRFDT